MKVLLIGCGAVGLAVAASLYDSGVETDLVARGTTGESLRKNGLQRKGIFKEIRIPPEKLNVFSNLEDTSDRQYDHVIICAKTTGNKDIAEDLRNRATCVFKDTNGSLILCQNGFGNERYYSDYIEKSRIYTASFAIGFERPLPFISKVTVFSSPIQIGALFGGDTSRLKPLSAAIEKGNLPCKITGDIEKIVWSKMLYNCTLNPLSALLSTNYGGLGQSEDAVNIMDQIIEEIFSVMKAAGYNTFWSDADAYKKDFYVKILPPTYQHRSSTLQDMERRIKTEIDSLNGMVVKIGEEYGVEVPYNRLICSLIKARESLY